MAAAQPNNRASLLAGLRTGGVRSVSVPHTAAPAGSFNVPRIPPSSSFTQPHTFFPEEEEVDNLSEMVSQAVHIRGDMANYHQSRTASLDSSGNRLSQQQQDLLLQRQYNAQLAAASNIARDMMTSPEVQNQAQLQLQMMQMEIMRLQAMAQMQQIAQFQAESAQAQRQQNWRGNGMPEPATAGARTQSFASSGCASPLAQLRARQMEQVYTQQSDEQNVPMTAALGGRFGSRPHQESVYPGTAYGQSLASSRGGTVSHPLSATVPNSASLGGGVSMSQSKSDSAISWRRNSASMLSKGHETARSSSPPKVSPPPSDTERSSPPLLHTGAKNRPEPLRFSTAISAVNAQAVTSPDGSDAGDDSSSSKSADDGSSSSPTTPLSGSSHMSSSSAREEASKKLFQGLGLGRPSIHVTAPGEAPLNVPQRIVSQLIRQPRGPPGAVDELGGKNFANRIRKKAIGGLGVLLEARERRDVIVDGEVY